MTLTQTEQLNRIAIRWAQAHRHQDMLDWNSFTGMLLDLAIKATQTARSAEDREFASDLYTLAGLSYRRSLEFMPVDVTRWMREAA